jgi:hypothetical protein
MLLEVVHVADVKCRLNYVRRFAKFRNRLISMIRLLQLGWLSVCDRGNFVYTESSIYFSSQHMLHCYLFYLDLGPTDWKLDIDLHETELCVTMKRDNQHSEQII